MSFYGLFVQNLHLLKNVWCTGLSKQIGERFNALKLWWNKGKSKKIGWARQQKWFAVQGCGKERKSG